VLTCERRWKSAAGQYFHEVCPLASEELPAGATAAEKERRSEAKQTQFERQDMHRQLADARVAEAKAQLAAAKAVEAAAREHDTALATQRTVLVFEQDFALEDAIGSHDCWG
jgi:hypothetical protein